MEQETKEAQIEPAKILVGERGDERPSIPASGMGREQEIFVKEDVFLRLRDNDYYQEVFREEQKFRHKMSYAGFLVESTLKLSALGGGIYLTIAGFGLIGAFTIGASVYTISKNFVEKYWTEILK